MNPVHQKIPVLIHNGKPICESLIIVEYIDEVWKSKTSLLPSDPYQRAQARFWADLINKKIYSAGTRIWAVKGEEQESAKKDFLDVLKLLEVELGSLILVATTLGFSTWPWLLTIVGFIRTHETFGNFSIEESCPKLMEWGKRCMEKEAISKSLADPRACYEYVLMVKKKHGI